MEIILATTNQHKIREINQMLGLRVKGQVARVKEDGKTFAENALKKAQAAAKKFGKIAIADDSGLMIDALGGGPGVRSARFARPATKENLCNKVLRLMKNKKNRKAKFVCAIAIVSPTGKEKVFIGQCPGKIIHEMRGGKGFGYDPIFVPQGFKKTFGQMSAAMKNRLSHRSQALKKVYSWITSLPGLSRAMSSNK